MNRYALKPGIIALASVLIAGCSDNKTEDPGPDRSAEYSEVITNISNNVIIITYKELNDKATALKSAVSALTANASAANLQAARDAWVATRKPWEQSEGFLYGPVDSEGIDPSMDTWPVDVEAMNNVLNSSATITAEVVASNDEARGFHLIEFLLWGEDGAKTYDLLTAREKEYLNAAATDLQNNTKKLYEGWISSNGNFVDNFLNPGTQGAYPSQTAVFEEIVEGLITIADEVANGKIEDPLNSAGSTPYPELEESRFSNNSKLDFADNMRSIQNIYTGKFNSAGGKGLSELVAAENAALDTKVKKAISDAIDGINAIPGTFTSAISANRAAVISAQEKVNELMSILQGELLPFVNSNLD